MTHPVDDWELTGRGMYPKLFPIAIRLLNLAVQSADVERVCKAHKIIHTKARNRLLTKTVQMLLYTYCNLRLLDASPELGDFLVDAMKGASMMMNRSLLPALLKTLTTTTTTNRCTTKKWTAQVRATGRFSSCSAATARHTPMKSTVVGIGA